jgi:hypothetical protein
MAHVCTTHTKEPIYTSAALLEVQIANIAIISMNALPTYIQYIVDAIGLFQ